MPRIAGCSRNSTECAKHVANIGVVRELVHTCRLPGRIALERNASVLRMLASSTGSSLLAKRYSVSTIAEWLASLGILDKADRLQPFPDPAHALSCSSNTLASFKSNVSKPSVNQL
jgi:hypothetical protein